MAVHREKWAVFFIGTRPVLQIAISGQLNAGSGRWPPLLHQITAINRSLITNSRPSWPEDANFLWIAH